MPMNPIRVTYPSTATGAQQALSVDWRDAPSGLTWEVQFNAGASGSVTVETTLDDVNDAAITPRWQATSAITATTRDFISGPVQAARVNISSLAGGTLTFKMLQGAPSGAGAGGGGGGPTGDVNIAEVGGSTIAFGGAFPASGIPIGFSSAAGSTLQNGVVNADGSLRIALWETGDAPLVLDNAVATGTYPVPIGGQYNATLPTYADTDRTQAQFTARGALINSPVTDLGVAWTYMATSSDAVSAGSGVSRPQVGAMNYVFDGTQFLRQRGNTTGSIVIPPQGWSYAAAAGGIVNDTTAVTIKAAAGSGVRNYLRSLQIETTGALGAATEVVVRDGAGGTVLWRGFIGTAGLTSPSQVTFENPIFSTANTLLEFATLTATVTGGVYVNAQGFTAP